MLILHGFGALEPYSVVKIENGFLNMISHTKTAR